MPRPLPLPGRPKIPGLRLATDKGRAGTSGNDGSANLLIEFGTTQSTPGGAGAAVDSISPLPEDPGRIGRIRPEPCPGRMARIEEIWLNFEDPENGQPMIGAGQAADWPLPADIRPPIE